MKALEQMIPSKAIPPWKPEGQGFLKPVAFSSDTSPGRKKNYSMEGSVEAALTWLSPQEGKVTKITERWGLPHIQQAPALTPS